MMPAQSVWMIRLSLIWFFFSIFFGSILLIHKAWSLHPFIWSLLPLHFETAVWGWLVQFVMGTAYWMFPRHLEGDIRGAKKPAFLMPFLFNAGLILLLAGHLQNSNLQLSLIGRILILISVILFAALMWGRVKSYRHIH